MIGRVLTWLKGQGGIIAAVLGIVAIIGAALNRSRKLGRLEQAIEQEKIEDQAEAEIANVHGEEVEAKARRDGERNVEVQRINAAATEQLKDVPKTANKALDDARASRDRARRSRINGAKR